MKRSRSVPNLKKQNLTVAELGAFFRRGPQLTKNLPMIQRMSDEDLGIRTLIVSPSNWKRLSRSAQDALAFGARALLLTGLLVCRPLAASGQVAPSPFDTPATTQVAQVAEIPSFDTPAPAPPVEPQAVTHQAPSRSATLPEPKRDWKWDSSKGTLVPVRAKREEGVPIRWVVFAGLIAFMAFIVVSSVREQNAEDAAARRPQARHKPTAAQLGISPSNDPLRIFISDPYRPPSDMVPTVFGVVMLALVGVLFFFSGGL